jgi:hypothetical protein
MPRSRDWLVQQGLAKKGKGRLSFAAKDALAKAIADGIIFDDIRQENPGEKLTIARQKVRAEAVIKALEPTRDESIFYVVEPGTKMGQSDVVIGFDICFACNRHVRYCTHELPKPPAWITSEEIFFEKPVV